MKPVDFAPPSSWRMVDVGDRDGLAASNRQLVDSLKTFGGPHTFEVCEGDHNNRVAERLERKVLPFFSMHLSAAASR